MIFVCFSFLNLGLGFVNCPSGSDMFGICLNRSAISKTGRIFFFSFTQMRNVGCKAVRGIDVGKSQSVSNSVILDVIVETCILVFQYSI